MKPKMELKPLFLERMEKLLGKDMGSYMEILEKPLQNSIRCNTLKITPENLLNRLNSNGWIIYQPFEDYPEIMIIKGKIADENLVEEDNVNGKSNLADSKEKNINNKNNLYDNNFVGHIKTSLGRVGEHFGFDYLDINNKDKVREGNNIIDLAPGELGRSMEHLLGYYYVQEIASMLSVLSLKPQPGELVLDIAAAPGSKTTQMAATMKNTGTIIANDVNIGRLKILASNMERCGATNAILTKKDGIALCKRLKQEGFQFDKILVDAPCSGEGTLRSSMATARMWNPKTIRNLSRLQKALLASTIEILKPKGELVYSTCTHAPEENEEVVSFVLEEFKGEIKIESISLPIKCRSGLTRWGENSYDKEVEKSCRIYPQDNDTEGFFLAKIKRVK